MGNLTEEGRALRKTGIALNRTLRAEWLLEALRLASLDVENQQAKEMLTELLKKEISGEESIRKSLRYLNAIWLSPSKELEGLRNNALEVYKGAKGKKEYAGLCYFMLMATYPFVREVNAICGRLIRLQGEVKMEQIKRRAAEMFGENTHSMRSTRNAVSVIHSLGILTSGEAKGSYAAGSHHETLSTAYSAFCIEALLRSYGASKLLKRQEIESHPALFAFNSSGMLDAALNESRFIISRESVSEEIVQLR